MDHKHLKLNENKTEYMFVGKKNCLRNIDFNNMIINGNQIQVVENVRNLGVAFDSSSTFGNQINNVVRTAGYHLRNIAFIKKYLDEDSVKKLVFNSVISRLDYCNSIYHELPKDQLKKLQRIYNRAARLIKGTSSRERITPVLIELHWLPIKPRIIFKICVMTHQAITTGCPPYLRELLTVLHPGENTINTRRATDAVSLFEPRCTSSIGFRAFKFATPRLYNNLPLDIRSTTNIILFKKKLKIYLFSDLTIKDLYTDSEYTIL